MSKVKFKESQQYKDRLVLVALGIVGLISIAKGLIFLFATEPNIVNAIFLFAVAIGIGVLVWWLTRLRLKVTVTEKNIKFKLSPIHTKKRSIPWKEIDKCEIVKTSKAAQWSGRNITFNREKRFSLTGRNGLAIKTKDGECFFIGCKDILGLRRVLRTMQLGLE